MIGGLVEHAVWLWEQQVDQSQYAATIRDLLRRRPLVQPAGYHPKLIPVLEEDQQQALTVWVNAAISICPFSCKDARNTLPFQRHQQSKWKRENLIQVLHAEFAKTFRQIEDSYLNRAAYLVVNDTSQEGTAKAAETGCVERPDKQ